MIGAEQVKLIAFDVDGTLTDGTLVMGSGGEAYKLFNAHDGLAISLAHRMGYAVGFITGRTSPIVEARAKELSCDFVLMGIRDKVFALQQLLRERAFCWDEAAYMGEISMICLSSPASVCRAARPMPARKISPQRTLFPGMTAVAEQRVNLSSVF